ncbi:prolyl oligopeptidase family serine peptidase [Mesorhizobium sp. M1156]|uniref:prolyl oligopeptidase family serine peptidase n=1 Tax=Mesorhizobium sp. M1156 TaxID=2957064 RepID=UPI00333AABCE
MPEIRAHCGAGIILAAYPSILLATTKWDDRVHPGHARKMAAKLQALGYPAYFYEPSAGGHSYGKDNRERPHSLPSATISFAVRSSGTPMAFDSWPGSNKSNLDDCEHNKIMCAHIHARESSRSVNLK